MKFTRRLILDTLTVTQLKDLFSYFEITPTKDATRRENLIDCLVHSKRFKTNELLGALTVSELREFAAYSQLEISSTERKPGIIEAIISATYIWEEESDAPTEDTSLLPVFKRSVHDSEIPCRLSYVDNQKRVRCPLCKNRRYQFTDFYRHLRRFHQLTDGDIEAYAALYRCDYCDTAHPEFRFEEHIEQCRQEMANKDNEPSKPEPTKKVDPNSKKGGSKQQKNKRKRSKTKSKPKSPRGGGKPAQKTAYNSNAPRIVSVVSGGGGPGTGKKR